MGNLAKLKDKEGLKRANEEGGIFGVARFAGDAFMKPRVETPSAGDSTSMSQPPAPRVPEFGSGDEYRRVKDFRDFS